MKRLGIHGSWQSYDQFNVEVRLKLNEICMGRGWDWQAYDRLNLEYSEGAVTRVGFAVNLAFEERL